MLIESTIRQATTWEHGPCMTRRAALRGLLAGGVSVLVVAPAILFSPFVGPDAAHADDRTPEKLPPPGVFLYTILRNGEPVGQQRLEVIGDGDKLRVISKTEVDVKFLGLSLYGFNQQLEEVRSGGRILALNSDAEDDGTDKQLRLSLEDELLKGSYNGKQIKPIKAGLVTSLFWQQPAPGPGQVIDCVKGKVRDVTVSDLGAASVELPFGRVSARHFKVAGEIKRELWYDDNGLLLAGELPGKDGSVIRGELLQRP
jgi:hypothetical protein